MLCVLYLVTARSLVHSLALGLFTGSFIGTYFNLQQYAGGEVLAKTGILGYGLLALLISYDNSKNKNRTNVPVLLPYSITALILAQLLFQNGLDLGLYASLLNFPIFVFTAHLTLKRSILGAEMRGFYSSLKIIMITSGMAILDQTVSNF